MMSEDEESKSFTAFSDALMGCLTSYEESYCASPCHKSSMCVVGQRCARLQTWFLLLISTNTFWCHKKAVRQQCTRPHLLLRPTLPSAHRWAQVQTTWALSWKWWLCRVENSNDSCAGLWVAFVPDEGEGLKSYRVSEGICLEVLVRCRLVWSRKWEESRPRDSHAKKPLVERSGEEGIQQVLMDKSQTKDPPTEAKPAHDKENTDETRFQKWIQQIRPFTLFFRSSALSTDGRGLFFECWQ